MNKLLYAKTGIVLGILVLLSVNVFAFAVSSAYEPGIKSLEINAGETKDVLIVLQNMNGGQDIIAKATMTQGSEIATLLDEDATYSIPFGEKTNVDVRVSIPKNAEVGDEYTIELSFISATGEEGSFGFGGGVEKIIPVVITKGQSSGVGNWIYLIILVLIVLIIIISKGIGKRKQKK